MVFPFHRSSNTDQKAAPSEEKALHTSFLQEGILFSASRPSENWLDQPLVLGKLDETVALLRQLEEEGYVQRQGQAVFLPWSSVYDLLDHPDYSTSLVLLNLPQVKEWRPVLGSSGGLTDPDFSITLSGWTTPEGIRLQRTFILTGAQLDTTGRETTLIPHAAWETVEALAAFHQRSPDERTPDHNKRAWARIRRAALRAKADLSDFLRKTVVLTPERLRLDLRKAQFGESKTVEVSPGFEDAPAGWLETFDRLPIVQNRYQIPDGEGLVHVLLPPEVQTVLREIKRLPGRRVSGERAEAFIRNPFAALGPDACQVIDPDQFEQAREDAAISYARFLTKKRNNEVGALIGASLLVDECLQGAQRSDELIFDDIEEIETFIRKLREKIQRNAQCCFWKGYDLEILGDTPDQLALLEEIITDLRTPAKISLDDLFDLSRYSDRIQCIDVEKPYYCPFIGRKDKDDGWYPENVQEFVLYRPEGATEPLALPIHKEIVDQMASEIQQAKTSGAATISVPGFPKPVGIDEAENLVKSFCEARRDVVAGSFKPEREKDKEPAKETKRLVVKPNVVQLDHNEHRGPLQSSRTIFPPALPKSLKENFQLKEHQLQGLGWLQYLWSQSPTACRGAILADDMGLGKTLQLLCFIINRYESDPACDPFLVVAPVSLLDNWREEVDRFFGIDAIPILTLYGADLSRKRLPREAIKAHLEFDVGRLLRDDWLGGAKLVLTTYETLRDVEFSLAGQRWSVIVCDEAQKIKNPNAMVTRAAKKQNARLKIACTGTPVENTLTDLWCLFDFVQPGLLGALNSFSTQYRKPIETREGDEEEKAMVQELRIKIEPQILRRLKVDVLNDLPAKVEVQDCRHLPLSDYQRKLYAQAIRGFRSRPEGSSKGNQSPLGLLQYLRRLCSDPRPMGQMSHEGESLAEVEARSPKMAWLMQVLVTIKFQEEKVILFCEFRDLQRTLQRAIAERFGIVPNIINGDTSTKARSTTSRQKQLKDFQARAGFGVIILSPLAVGFGVNIQAANHVIHFTRPWNPAKEDQATDRAYRIGQSKDVFVYYPVVTAKDFTTFDAKLDALLNWKRELSKDMLNGSEDISPADFGDLEDVDGTKAFVDVSIGEEDLAAMTPDGFEIFCAVLWNACGYATVYRTPKSGDGGVDVVALQGKEGVLIQCKSSSIENQQLGWDGIKEVVAGAAAYSVRHPGVFFKKVVCTNQGFNETAVQQARLNHVELIDRIALRQLLKEKKVTQGDVQKFLFSQCDFYS